MTRRRRIPLLIASLLIIPGAGAGCSIDLPPKATVTGVEVTEQSPQGSVVMLTVELENPNDVDLPLPKAQYSIHIEQIGTFNFIEVPDVALPRKGRQIVRLPAAFDATNLEGRKFDVSGGVTYYPPGEIRRLLTEYQIPLPFSLFGRSGTLGEPVQ